MNQMLTVLRVVYAIALFRQDRGFDSSCGSHQLPVFNFLSVCSCYCNSYICKNIGHSEVSTKF